MHDDRRLVEQRVRRQLVERVLPSMHRWSTPLDVSAWEAPGEPVGFAEATAAVYTPFAVGSHYGKPWGTTWFRLRGEVPADRAGADLEAVIDLGFHPDAAGFQCEGLVWTADGEPLQGVHPRRMSVPLGHLPAGPFTLWVEAASNPSFPQFAPSPLGRLETAGDRALYRLRRADLAVLDTEVYGLLLDAEVLLGLMSSLDAKDPRRARVLRSLEHAFDTIEHDGVAAARHLLRPALDLPARASAHRIVAVGHAHIDSAWLWPLRETIRKCARTFASATRLMDDDPSYVFVCSQAAQYDWIERGYPSIFERIRQRVERGQWQPVGAMWVEPDMNLPSGESLVRQLVVGQRYFESRFGRRCDEVWIPDVFGYPASLPQVFAAAGCRRFVTQKLSWNKQNRFPHHTFWWEGLDGTRVLTHFPPVDTYNATVVGAELGHAQSNFKDHDWSDWSLMPYGYGNGGGGPTREMVERAHRFADIDGSPRVELGTTAQFFDHVDAEVAAGAPVPVWRGELYFEMHRGTLTSQLGTKLGNRTCERLLWEAELWWALAGGAPPDVQAVIDDAWREVLLRQFHDIIPGSSIGWVHDEAEATLGAVAERLESLVGAALDEFSGPEVRLASARRNPGSEVIDVDGAPVLVHVQPLCVHGVDPLDADPVITTEHSMTNEWLSVRWDLDGEITSIIDVAAGRELLSAPVTVRLAPDQPVEYDAWDLESWTVAAGRAVGGVRSAHFVEQHPLRARFEVRRAVGAASTMTQTYTLCADSRRVDITFDIDWHEDEHYLSLHVPLDIRTDQALCDIQFGHVARPTHTSTSWDAAKFEVCAHRWVALEERGYGAAVLNDGRYGHGVQGGGVQGGGVRVSLLRAPKYPDPEADLGPHRVTVSVMAFTALTDVIAEAEALNVPVRLVPAADVAAAGAAEVTHGPVIDHPGVQVSAVKRADDGSGDWIVRLYEACGSRSQVTVRLAERIRSAERCNLLEDAGVGIDVADGIVALVLRPFELVTLRLRT